MMPNSYPERRDQTTIMGSFSCILFLLQLHLGLNMYSFHMRGSVVEWLERLAVVRKVAGSSPARAKRLENSHCPPSSEWVPEFQGRLKAAKGEDWAPPFICRA